MIQSSDVIEIVRLFESNAVDVWLAGGWGVDALLGEQPREHADIDVVNRLEPGTMDIGFARSPWIHVGGGRSSNVFCTVTYGAGR